jgi:AhpD family alkylhydroperoxidase
MEARFNYLEAAPNGYKALVGTENYLNGCGLEKSLLHLIKLRASQINGCGFCLDMHWKDLKAIGEKDERLYSLDAWRECPYYTERERAALAWTEALTLVTSGHAPDTVYEEVHTHFTEKELADLTLAIAVINAWNRMSIAARTEPGKYRAAKAEVQPVSGTGNV